jgi:hypothetical protein
MPSSSMNEQLTIARCCSISRVESDLRDSLVTYKIKSINFMCLVATIRIHELKIRYIVKPFNQIAGSSKQNKVVYSLLGI